MVCFDLTSFEVRWLYTDQTYRHNLLPKTMRGKYRTIVTWNNVVSIAHTAA